MPGLFLTASSPSRTCIELSLYSVDIVFSLLKNKCPALFWDMGSNSLKPAEYPRFPRFLKFDFRGMFTYLYIITQTACLNKKTGSF